MPELILPPNHRNNSHPPPEAQALKAFITGIAGNMDILRSQHVRLNFALAGIDARIVELEMKMKKLMEKFDASGKN